MVMSKFLKSICLSFLLQAHRKHAEFLNKRIEMYDELAIVVGKDMATGSLAKRTLITLRMLLIMARMVLWIRGRML